MKAYNKKHKPKHMVVRNFRLFIAGGYYELCYYNRFTKHSYTLVDTGFVAWATKRRDKKIENGEVINTDCFSF